MKKIITSLALYITFSLAAQTETYSWKSVAMGGGGFVTGIVTSADEQNLMYARTDVGGAYRWNAANSQWIPLLDWVSENQTGYMGVEALAIDPSATNKLYMLVGTSYFNSGATAILRSNDYGATFSISDVTAKFKAHGNGGGRQNGERLAVDPNKGSILFCGTRSNGLFKSTDAGVSWSVVSSFAVPTTPSGNGINCVLMDPSSASKGNATQTFYVAVSATGNNLFVTKDGGTSFNAIAGAPTALMPQRMVLAEDGTLYITYADTEGPGNATTGQVWKYKGSTWTNITPAGVNKPFGGISVDPKNSLRIVIATINTYMKQYTDVNAASVWGDRMYLSTDGGSAWKDLVGNNGLILDANGCTWINKNSIHWTGSIEFNPFNSSQVHVVSGNGIFTCNDVSATQTTWKFNVTGMEETVAQVAVSISGGPFVSVILDYDGFTHNDVVQYSPIHSPRMGSTTGLAFGGGKLLRTGTNNYYSLNNGTSWTKCTTKGAKGKVAISADGKTFLHCPEGSTTTYYSTDNGSNWTACGGLTFNSIPVADAVNSNKFYAYENTGGKFYVSTDGGKNFSSALTLNTYGSKLLRAVPGVDGELWFAAGWDGLKRSVNSGQSFTKLSGVSNCASVGFGAVAAGKIFPTVYIWGTVNGVKGVFRSIDEGASWLRVNDDAHQYGGPGNGQFVIGDMNVFGRVYMSTVGRGIVYGESSLTTAVEISENKSMSVFPNPFSKSIFIQAEGNFSYSIIDLSGKIVESGIAQNSVSTGSNLTTGLYVVQIKTNSEVSFLKVIKN
ncbi:MAG: T9SS type A sorting domain-containing protein [Bacteroidetes bacterium]|nr:T9SS type A sorting domain-containing protein [Bacteroidota bacterium]